MRSIRVSLTKWNEMANMFCFVFEAKSSHSCNRMFVNNFHILFWYNIQPLMHVGYHCETHPFNTVKCFGMILTLITVWCNNDANYVRIGEMLISKSATSSFIYQSPAGNDTNKKPKPVNICHFIIGENFPFRVNTTPQLALGVKFHHIICALFLVIHHR